MDWERKVIEDYFNGVVVDSKRMNTAELDKKYSSFKNSFEKLYNMAIESSAKGTVNESRGILKMMLDSRDKMLNGTMSPMNTDMFVGNQLGKKYVYPLVGEEPTANEYKKALNTIKKKMNEI